MPGNVCNLRCPYCITGKRGQEEEGVMPLTMFETIYDKIKAHAKIVWLYDQGEPFVIPHLLQMVERLTGSRIFVHLDSNFASRKFSDDFSEQIVRSNLHYIRISADGVSQKSYEKYRVGGSIETVFSNIASVCNAKRRLGSPYPVLTWKFLISRFNEHEIALARRLAQKWGIEICYDILVSEDASWYSSQYNLETKILPEGWRPKEQDSIDIGQTYAKIWQPHEMLHPCCSQPIDTMIVNRNGLVFPCCSVPQTSQYLVGDLFRDDVETIWNNVLLAGCREFVMNYGATSSPPPSVCSMFPCMIHMKTLHDTKPLYSVAQRRLPAAREHMDEIGNARAMVWGADTRAVAAWRKAHTDLGYTTRLLGFVEDRLGYRPHGDNEAATYTALELPFLAPDIMFIPGHADAGIVSARLDTLGLSRCERYSI